MLLPIARLTVSLLEFGLPGVAAISSFTGNVSLSNTEDIVKRLSLLAMVAQSLALFDEGLSGPS